VVCINNNLIGSIVVACFVSVLFYISFNNSTSLVSSLDHVCFWFGVFLPFVLPFMVFYKYRGEIIGNN